MNKLLILDDELNKSLIASKKIEESINGDWLYFDSSDGVNATALFKIDSTNSELDLSSATVIEAHEDFIKKLLGLFTPSLNQELTISKTNNFTEFCLDLNDLLKKKIEIFDLSRKHFWIWHEADSKNKIIIGHKLKDFLEIT